MFIVLDRIHRRTRLGSVDGISVDRHRFRSAEDKRQETVKKLAKQAGVALGVASESGRPETA